MERVWPVLPAGPRLGVAACRVPGGEVCFLHLGLFLEGWVTPQKWDVPGEDGRVELGDGTCVFVGGAREGC